MGKKFLILLQISGGLRQKFSAEVVTVIDRNNSSKPIKCYSLEDISNKIFSNSSDIVPKAKINDLINDENRKEFFKNFLNATIATSILFK